ncbi:ABC transporter permease [Cohnella cholangitidis]|uniref:ABC transporter permease n=1 Tax=Cohnella cholangitidis TaxID=2598458 RepID=A0A7G5BSG8_9BACL|nr:ABC transporter permease [Cohnella cholangitidis]QMV39902.1 ABC transporter permease [Cohnella cholangitidis]
MRTGALIKRIMQQMARDKRTLALLFVAPLLILTLMHFVFNGNVGGVEPKLGIINVERPLSQALEQVKIKLVEVQSDENDTIEKNELDGVLRSSEGKLTLLLVNSDPSRAKALQMQVNQAIAGVAIHAALPSMSSQLVTLETSYVYGDSETTFFDVLSPVLVGFFVFFFVFLISGIGLLRERTTGTLERLMSTPIRRGELISGYLAGYGIFAVIQTVIVVLFAVNVLDISLVGSIWNVLLINFMLALVALSLGILLSTFAASEFQMVQFIPVVVVPQIFFAGIVPMDGMADWLQAVSRIMPLYYAADALKGVMYRGVGFGEIIGDLIVLALFAAIFIVLNALALKKYRKSDYRHS